MTTMPTPSSNVTERVEREESTPASRVRANTPDAVNYDLTDPANPKIKGADGDWHPAPGA